MRSTLFSAMLNVSDVQDQIANLRDNAISLADFDHWVMSVGWNLHKRAPVDSRVYNLVRDIQGYLVEYQHEGEYAEAELRSQLFSLVPLKPIRVKVSFNFDREPEPEPEPVITM